MPEKTFMKKSISWFPVLLGIIFLVAFLSQVTLTTNKKEEPIAPSWQAPDINLVSSSTEGDLIRYGRELIVNTSSYFGPQGSVARITNGMNCGNCHVMGGTKPFGSSFALVASSFPQVRNRSGKLESVEFRINDCMERSLNGNAIDSLSTEMRAMVSYIKWVGQGVTKENKPVGSGIIEIPFLARAADPKQGGTIYQAKCSRCHGSNGEGIMNPDAPGYIYPPLWGAHSFNTGAGLFRITRLAAFIKYNMPFDLVMQAPQLSDEEAWDLAAFISSQPRPVKIFPNDWPRLESKPPDHPFGPYVDHFPEQQHKFGPFGPIKEAVEKYKVGLK
jgi:thiosulfate dehydrogenase